MGYMAMLDLSPGNVAVLGLATLKTIKDDQA